MDLTSLISYWKLDEASGDRADVHGGITLNDINTVASAAGLVYANAADFEADNLNEQIRAIDPVNLRAGDIEFTLAGWFKCESIGANQLLCIKQNPATNAEYRLLIDTTGSLSWTVWSGDGTGQDGVSGLTTITAGNWFFFVADHNPATDLIRLQINNGSLNTQAHTGGIWVSTGNFRLGLTGDTTFPFDGLIGPFMVWKRILTTQERTDLYNGGAGLTYAAMSGNGFLLVKN